MSKLVKLLEYKFELPANKQEIIDELTRRFVDDNVSAISGILCSYSLHCQEEVIEFTEKDEEEAFNRCLESMIEKARFAYTSVYNHLEECVKLNLESEAINRSVCNALQERFAGIEIIDCTDNSIKFSIDTDYVNDPDDVSSYIYYVMSDFKYLATELLDGFENHMIDFLQYTEFVYDAYLDLSMIDFYLEVNLDYNITDL